MGSHRSVDREFHALNFSRWLCEYIARPATGRRAVKIVPTRYAMCSQSWELEVEQHGLWFETMAWGVYTDRIVRHLGGDPSRHIAVGIGYGLERVAMLKYGIDDIRKIETAQVA